MAGSHRPGFPFVVSTTRSNQLTKRQLALRSAEQLSKVFLDDDSLKNAFEDAGWDWKDSVVAKAFPAGPRSDPNPPRKRSPPP